MLKIGPCFNFLHSYKTRHHRYQFTLFVFQINCTLKNTKHSHMPKKSSSFHHHLTNYFKQIQAGIVFLVLPSLISSILYSKLEQSTP